MKNVHSSRLRMMESVVLQTDQLTLSTFNYGSSVCVDVRFDGELGSMPLVNMEILPDGRIIMRHYSAIPDVQKVDGTTEVFADVPVA